jgi:hypothetical protein
VAPTEAPAQNPTPVPTAAPAAAPDSPPLVFEGTASIDHIVASSANDILVGGAGGDIFDGGEGTDTAKLSGNASDYTLTRIGGLILVSDRRGLDGSDLISNVERLQFGDMMIALDVDGNAGTALRLYQAAFHRMPDMSGLGFWIDRIDHGTDPAAIAFAFVQSSEFGQLYGANPTVEEFVGRLYQNALNREPDGPGYQWWVDTIKATGQALDEQLKTSLLMAFSNSSENIATVVGSHPTGVPYTAFGG